MKFVAVAVVTKGHRKSSPKKRPEFDTREAAAQALFASRPEVRFCITGTGPEANENIQTHERPE